MFYFFSSHIAARTLHYQMFSSILRAPILFFDSTPIGVNRHLYSVDEIILLILGRIINRFSKDMLSVDDELSEATYSFNEVICLF